MNYLTFSTEPQETYTVALLVPDLNSYELEKCYVKPHLEPFRNKIIAYDLYKTGKRTAVSKQKEYLNELLPILMDLQVKYLVVSDAEYFKTLTKAATVDSALGYVMDCIVGEFKVVYVPNYSQMFYDPDRVTSRISQGLTALNNHFQGCYSDPGNDVIKYMATPTEPSKIKWWLDKLLAMDCDLTADIEGFSLKHYDSGIGSISFSWNQHEGIAFPVDVREPYGPLLKGQKIERFHNEEVRALLKDFFIQYAKTKNKMIWHNISFDVYILIYQLFMDDLLDTSGLLDGLDTMLANWDCTKLITYLATNSCAGNKLGLKVQAQEFAGNYAVEEIKDITKLSMDSLLEYNLVDTLSTWFVHNKHYQTMIDDEQQEIYEGLFKDAIVDIIQMQLTGLPVDMEEVKKAEIELRKDSADAVSRMYASGALSGFDIYLKQKWLDKMHSKWKTKTMLLKDVPDKPENTFNPNSGPQLQELLFGDEFMSLPVLDLTDTKQPATGVDTLKKLKNHTKNKAYLEFLDALIDFSAVAIILSTFIPALLRSPMASDGWHYMFGNFNLGGTLSGRLSSSKPNLQNLPSSSRYAKLIKRCIKAPKGFLFVGLDFASLEDRISALTTKDPNKLKVYTDGYDGHSLRAFFYFSTKMPDIIDTVESINSIQEKYKPLRQESKAPTFALTYQGTYHTLMANCGFSEEKAKDIEAKYHDAYKVSDDWVAAKLQEATKVGFITVAFGLRVRTPLLKQVILGTKKTPYEASAEGRTAGNALGQSWCLLNSRAASEFMQGVRKSKYRLDIRPCAHIHDAQYYLIPDDLELVQYMNKHLVAAVEWQDHPEIYHDQVKLGGELSIFYPDWSAEMVIPNAANDNEINEIAHKHYLKYCA